MAAPSGGPADTIPPRLIAVTPENRSVLAGFEGKVRFDFSETISERGIDRAVMIYPFEPRPNVDKGGRHLEVRPRQGWRRDRIYHVVIEPLVQDLFDNRMGERLRHVLSTGPPVPENAARGTVFDRMTGRPLPEGRVDLIRLPDTLRYGTGADSVGRFGIGALPPGEYLAIGYEDRNQNRRADAQDRADTTRVAIEPADSIELVFRVFEHDTIAPVLARVRALDTVTVELGFDRYLDPGAPVSASSVAVVDSATGAAVAIDTVLHDWAYTEWLDRRRAMRDTAADDTLAADTVDVDTLDVDTRREAEPADTAAAGTTEAVQDTLPLPARRLIAVARSAIPSGTYVVRAEGVRGLSGLVGGGEAVYTQPEPPPPPEGEQGSEDGGPP